MHVVFQPAFWYAIAALVLTGVTLLIAAPAALRPASNGETERFNKYLAQIRGS